MYKHVQIAQGAFKYLIAFSCMYRECSKQNRLNHPRIKISTRKNSNTDGLRLCQ